MKRDTLVEILDGLDVHEGEVIAQLCVGFSRALGVAGAGVALVSDGHPDGSLGSSGGLAADGEELQSSLGEGPAVDASRTRALVAEPDLARAWGGRWVAFSDAALACGIAAVFASPLGVGAASLGALTLYQAVPGPLTDAQTRDLGVLADVVTQVMLALQAKADPGALAVELADVGSYRPEVHQATGMVSVQLGVSLAEALVRLRGHAYARSRSLPSVARDVVARKLRMAAC